MTTTSDLSPLISYPARPVNGGRLEDAPPKVGPWVYQPKIDDWRGVLHVPTLRVWNRHGQPCSVLVKLRDALLEIGGNLAWDYHWLDIGIMENRNDMMRGTIVVFDIITPELTQQERRDVLVDEFEEMTLATNMLAHGPVRDRVFLIQEFVSTSPETLYQILQGENVTLCRKFYEGLVAKRTDKPYPVQLLSPEKETPWMIKHRFDQ